MFIYLLFLFYSLLPYTTCFLYNSFVHASNLPTCANYTFLCKDNTENEITFTIHLQYLSKEENETNLRSITSKTLYYFKTNKITYDNYKCHIIDFDNSKDKLNLLFCPLTIDPSNKKADLLLFNLFSRSSIEDLEFIQYWYTYLSITLLNNVKLHIHYLTHKSFDNQQYNNNITKNLYPILLRYKDSKQQNTNKEHFNLACLNNLINFNSREEIASAHNYLYTLDELYSADKITTVILDNTNDQPLNRYFLQELRKTFCNLSTTSCLNCKLNYNELLNPDTGMLILQTILYNEQKNYNPLTFYVDDCKTTHKEIQKNVLLWYKYARIETYIATYFLLNLFQILYEMHFMESLGLYNQFPTLLGDSLLAAPVIHCIAGIISKPVLSINTGTIYSALGFKINPKAYINKSDYFVVISILLQLGYLMELKKNLPLKTLLIHRIYLVGFLTLLVSLNGFEAERLVFDILSNKHIFKEKLPY